jgi:hypothetical protein
MKKKPSKVLGMLGALAVVGMIFGAFDFAIDPIARAVRPKKKVS